MNPVSDRPHHRDGSEHYAESMKSAIPNLDPMDSRDDSQEPGVIRRVRQGAVVIGRGRERPATPSGFVRKFAEPLDDPLSVRRRKCRGIVQRGLEIPIGRPKAEALELRNKGVTHRVCVGESLLACVHEGAIDDRAPSSADAWLLEVRRGVRSIEHAP
jgi:hypothetical protein